LNLLHKILPHTEGINTWQDAMSAIGNRGIVKNISFIMYCVMLALLYITIIHKSENRMRNLNEYSKTIRELTWQYKDERSKLMFLTKESELVKSASELGLNVNLVTPKKIEIIQ
jgi:hypothetical protein